MNIPTQGHETKTVNIRQLKQFANSRLRKKPILQKLIITEKDQLTVEEFLELLDPKDIVHKTLQQISRSSVQESIR